MKKRIVYFAIAVLVGCLMANEGWAQEKSSGDFDKLKQLEGKWKGTKPDGKMVEVTYEIMSGGSAIIEKMMPEGEPSMVSVYHLDGDKLMMTHYCSAGNQPRMESVSSENGNLNFNLVDVSNLNDKSEGHMRGLEVVFVDDNHFNQIWTWSEDGKEMPGTFKLERVM